MKTTPFRPPVFLQHHRRRVAGYALPTGVDGDDAILKLAAARLAGQRDPASGQLGDLEGLFPVTGRQHLMTIHPCSVVAEKNYIAI